MDICISTSGRALTQMFWKPLLKFQDQVLILVISRMPKDITILNKHIAPVRGSVDSNKKPSAGRLHEHYNAIAQQFGIPTASVSILKRCITPHSGHKNSQNYNCETMIKFGKVPNTGANIPSIYVQYCSAFVIMKQQKQFCFDKRFPQDYSTINSTDAKAPVILGSKNSFNMGHTWLSYINEDDCWSPLEEKTEDLLALKSCKDMVTKSLLKDNLKGDTQVVRTLCQKAINSCP